MQEIIALLNKQPGKDFTATEIGEALLAEGGVLPPLSALRLSLRDLSKQNRIVLIDNPGMLTKYHSVKRNGVEAATGPERKPAPPTPAPPPTAQEKAAQHRAPPRPEPLTPAEILAEAKAEAPRTSHTAAAPYMDAIHTLKALRGFRWQEIAAWLKVRGVQISVATLCKSYGEWAKKRPPEKIP